MKPDPALEARLADLVGLLTLSEKIGLIPTRQEAVPRLGLTEFWIGGEAAHGLVARDGPTTVFPQTLGLSCTWDPLLLEKVGAVVGDEARAYHRLREGLSGLCLWAPTVDLERDPRWGRTEEGWGEDPVLTGLLASAYVRGLQGRHPRFLKTVATLKHFFANNHEAGRTSTSSDIPDDLLSAYYLKVFELVIKQGRAQSIMTAYNAVNGVPAMLRPEINEVVRGQWGWDGFVVCDGGALGLLVSDHRAFATWAEAVAASLRAGIDCFPEDGDRLKPAVTEALERGLITEGDLDRAVTRTLRARLRLGLVDAGVTEEPHPFGSLTTTILHRPESRVLAREAAVKAAVLLKNDGVLPLSDSLGTLAVLGPLADAVYRDWYTGKAFAPVSPLKALVERLGSDRVVAADGCDLVALRTPDGLAVGVAGWNDPGLVASSPLVQAGELYRRTDWGWGTQTFQSLANGNFVTTDDVRLEASAAEVWGWFTRERFGVPVGRGPWTTWKGDRVGLDARGRVVVAQGDVAPDFTVEVIREGLTGAVAAARVADAAVVFVGNHPLINGRETEDRPSLELAPDQVRLIRAVAAVHSRTIVVIVGSYPFAIGDWQDEVSAVLYTAHGGQEAGHAVADLLFGDAAPGGRLSMTWYRSEADLPPITDYDIARNGRTHLYYQGEPLYPFGHGLGYTTFAYKGLRWDSEAQEASVIVTNTGCRTGDEVVQFYRGRELVGFSRITLAAGESRLVRCPLPRSALSASLPLTVGSSSTDLRLTLSPQGIL